MSDINLKDLLEEPDFSQRASNFANQTLWDLFSKYNNKGVRIDLMTSEQQHNMAARWIESFRHLADSNGILKLSNAPYGKSGDDSINSKLSWDFNEMISEERAWEILSANNSTVSASFNMEIEGVTNIEDHNWDAVLEAFKEIALRAIDLRGNLRSRMKSWVYRRYDDTICIQIFTTFLFNDIEQPQPLENMTSYFEKIVKLIRGAYRGSLQEFTIGDEDLEV